ncbi:MAG TPA: C4-type zinc ribbon domain-containing protein [Acidimicrobiales bacterium]|nr:C4-type zinc ribbon domain-containing protein [Acidimicrobiales bacterium]
MNALDVLLDVQDHDTRIDQLEHRRRHLAEREELVGLRGRRAAVAAARGQVATTLDEITERQRRAENEIEAAEKRVAEIDARMRSGAVRASRDLQAMQGEIDTIRERVSGLEDVVLEALEEREPLDAEVRQHDEELEAVDSLIAEAEERLASAEREVDAELEGERSLRAAAAGRVADDLMATYEGLRTRLGGIGAARLDGNRCAGCHLTLPATELDRIRHADRDELVFCDQCGRILVRTG